MTRLRFLFDEEEKEEEKPGWEQRTRGIGELPKYEFGKMGLEKAKDIEIPESTKLKFTADIGIGAKAVGGAILPEVEEIPSIGVSQRMRGIGEVPKEYSLEGITTDLSKANKTVWSMWWSELKTTEDKWKFLKGENWSPELKQADIETQKLSEEASKLGVNINDWIQYGVYATFFTAMAASILPVLSQLPANILNNIAYKVEGKTVKGPELMKALRRVNYEGVPGIGKPSVLDKKLFAKFIEEGGLKGIGGSLKKGITITETVPRFAFASKLYAGLPADEIAKSIIEVGKVTSEAVKGLDPVKVSQVTQQLLATSPALASEFLKAVEKPEITPKVEKEETISGLSKPDENLLKKIDQGLEYDLKEEIEAGVNISNISKILKKNEEKILKTKVKVLKIDIEEKGKVGLFGEKKTTKWIEDFKRAFGRGPTDKELKEIATEQLTKGYEEIGGKVEPDIKFTHLEKALKEIEEAKKPAEKTLEMFAKKEVTPKAEVKEPVNDTWKLTPPQAEARLSSVNMDLYQRSLEEAVELGLPANKEGLKRYAERGLEWAVKALEEEPLKKVTPPAEPKEALKAKGKESWEMTREEISKISVEKGEEEYKKQVNEWNKLTDEQKMKQEVLSPLNNKNWIINATKSDYLIDHKTNVINAVKQGKPVPPEVLADYPELKAKAPTKADFEALKTTDKNKELFYEKYNQVYTETKKAYDKLLDEKVADLKEEGFKGVTKGGVKRDEEGYVVGKFPATSKNPKWYRDFYEAKGKAPTNKDLREIAIQQLSQGHTEDYGEVPANSIFNKLEAQLESYETILADIKSGDYSFETPKNITKLNDKLRELDKQNKKLTKDYETELVKLKEEKKIIVGQTQKKIEIAERNILEHVMKGQIKEAKRAFREGKKEGIFEQKEHFHEVVARAKERKAKRDEIGKVKDILKKTKLRELRPERQNVIKKIIDEIGLAKMTEKTKRKLTSRLDYVKDNPDNQIPPEKIADLERLNKKPLSDFTSRDIALVKDSILHEINLNKLKNKIIFGKEIKEAVVELKEARANVLKGKDIKKYDDSIIDSGEVENRGLWQRIKNFWNIDSFNPEVICEELDNQDHGVIMKYVFKGIDNGITDKERLKREMDIWFTKELKGIDISNWSKSFQTNKKDIDFQTIKLSDGRTIKITKGERLSFLLHEKNEKNYAHLIKGGFRFSDNIARKYKITEDNLDEIINSATPEEVKVADTLWKFFNEKIKPELNKTFIELNGWEIATEDNYYPIRTVSLDRIRDALKARKTFDNKTLEGMGIFKERVNAKNALIIEDAFTVALKHLEATSSYIGLAKPLRYAKLILEDTELQENVMRVYGKVYLNNLKRYLKEIEDDSINLDNADKLTVELINKLDSAILGLHIFVMFKQPVSYLVANTEIDSKYLKKALLKKTDFEEIRKYSPQLEQRIRGFIFRELGELGNVGKVRQFFLHKSPLNSKLLSGIRKADSITIGKIWNAVKIETKEKYPDLSEEEFFNKVTERAEEIIRRTQPTWHPKDRSEVGRSRSIWLRLLTKYTSQRNKNRIVLKRATLKYNRSKHTGKDKIDLLKKYSIILIINGLLIEAINELRRKSYGNKSRNVWQYIVASIGTTLSNFYIVGDLFSSLASKIQKGTYAGYDTGNIVISYMDNAIDGLAELGRTLDQLKTRERYKSGSRKGNLKWKTTALRSLDKNASSLLAFKGIPYDNIKRLVSGIWKMAGEKEEKKPPPLKITIPKSGKLKFTEHKLDIKSKKLKFTF